MMFLEERSRPVGVAAPEKGVRVPFVKVECLWFGDGCVGVHCPQDVEDLGLNFSLRKRFDPFRVFALGGMSY